MAQEGLPPLTSHGVFTASASITIDAPRDVVWRVLMDWGSYHHWYVPHPASSTNDSSSHLQEPICVRVASIQVVTPCLIQRSRNQCLTDASKKPLPASQQTPRAGAHLLIHPVHIPPSFDPPRLFPAGSAFEIITTVDTDNYRCAWENVEYPSWLLTAVRWQVLVEVVEDGRKKTRYETIEVFGGLLAYLIKLFVGSGLQAGFRAMAEGLKKRSEEMPLT